jgi:hypothetical protein
VGKACGVGTTFGEAQARSIIESEARDTVAEWETDVLRKAVQNLRCALLVGLLTTLLLPAVACDPLAKLAPSAPSTTFSSLSPGPIGEETASVGQAPLSNPSTPLATGSGQRIEFERISLEQGLSQGVVTNTLQDSKGFIWFGTQDGLNRYDGYEFAIYKLAEGRARGIGHPTGSSRLSVLSPSCW